MLQRLGHDAEGLESIYGSVPRTEAHFDLQRHQIEIQETLGIYYIEPLFCFDSLRPINNLSVTTVWVFLG